MVAKSIEDPKNGFKALISYDLETGVYGQWVVENKQYFSTYSMKGKYNLSAFFDLFHSNLILDVSVVLASVRGSLYSFDNIEPHQTIGSVYENGTWHKLNKTFDSKNHWPVYVTPYFVRK